MLKSLKTCVWIAIVVAVTPLAVFAQSVGVSVQQPPEAFQLDTDPTAAQSITIHTTYTGVAYDHLYVCLSMVNPMRGTGANTDTIPVSAIQVSGGRFATWTSVVGAGGCGIPTAQPVWDGNVIAWWWTGTHDDTLSLRIAGYSPSLQADTYTGTITVYAGFF